MRCNHCGTENPPETRFCGTCGQPVEAEPLSAGAGTPPLKHSALGIASLSIGVVGGGAMLVLFVLAGVFHAKGLGEKDLPVMIAGLLLFLDCFLLFVGGVLGVVAMFSTGRNKVTAIVGIILNALPVLLFVVLFVVGLAVGGK